MEKNIKSKDELGDYGELPAVIKDKVKYSDEPSKVPGLDEYIKKCKEEENEEIDSELSERRYE